MRKELTISILRVCRRLLTRDPVSFWMARRRHVVRTTPDSSRTEHKGLLDELVAQGICVVRDYMPPSRAEDIRQQVAPLMQRIRAGEDIPDTRSARYPEYGCYHLDEADEHLPLSRGFIEDSMIRSIAEAYGGGKIEPHLVRAEFRSDPLKNELVDDLHSDTWRFRFKAMLYLTDVTEGTSPFRYVIGSHRPKRRLRRYLYDYIGNTFEGRPVDRYRIAEARRLSDHASFTETVVTGPAGTLILFDSRGLHSGTPLREESRVILVQSFAPAEDL